MVGNDGVNSGEDEFQNLTDGEESLDAPPKEEEIQTGEMNGKDLVAGEVDKKGSRRGLVKPNIVTWVSSEARIVMTLTNQ